MNKLLTKAIGFTQFGGPEVLKILEIPIPELKSNQVLIEVKAISTNPIDTKVRIGRKGGIVDENNPKVVGYDAAGVIVETGSDVKGLSKGDEVYYVSSINLQGAYSKLQPVDSRVVSKKPKSLSWVEAAALPLVTLTAWETMIERMKIPTNKEQNKGKYILITAGAGGVGSIAIQIAKQLLGLNVIASASRQDTIDYAKKCGADVVINHRNPLPQELEKIGFKEVDYVFHCWELSNDYTQQLSQITKPFGVIGVLTAIEPINLGPFFSKSITLAHEFMFARQVYGVEIERHGQILSEVAELIDNKVLFSPLTDTKPFTLDNIVEAHKKLEKGTVIGKLGFDKLDEF